MNGHDWKDSRKRAPASRVREGMHDRVFVPRGNFHCTISCPHIHLPLQKSSLEKCELDNLVLSSPQHVIPRHTHWNSTQIHVPYPRTQSCQPVQPPTSPPVHEATIVINREEQGSPPIIATVTSDDCSSWIRSHYRTKIWFTIPLFAIRSTHAAAAALREKRRERERPPR